jgi:hypothetical protein
MPIEKHTTEAHLIQSPALLAGNPAGKSPAGKSNRDLTQPPAEAENQ